MDERMLRHALMEANLERFRDVLDAAEEPDWSHRYLRNRTRLLADPFGWAKRMARPVWKLINYFQQNFVLWVVYTKQPKVQELRKNKFVSSEYIFTY